MFVIFELAQRHLSCGMLIKINIGLLTIVTLCAGL